MKKELIQVMAPLALCVLSASSVYASNLTLAESHAKQGISTEPDSEGWYHVYECGMTLGTETSQNAKYRLGKSVVCEENEDDVPAFLMLGEGTQFDLNGKTIDCAADEDSGYDIAVGMHTRNGQLIGSVRDESRKGKILNCYGNDTLTMEGGVTIGGYSINLQEAIITEYNTVTRVKVEDSETGFLVLSNHNQLFENSAQRCIVGFSLHSNNSHTYLKGNVFSDNTAYDNELGFVEMNGIPNFDLNLDGEESSHRNYNLFVDNVSEYNYEDGFLIASAGSKYVDNYAANNAGHGFNYTYSHNALGSNFPLVLSIFHHNQAFDNNRSGFAATGADWSNLAATPPVPGSSGALFINNTAFGNGVENGHDLYDSHHSCANSLLELNHLNRWISNEVLTANPECARGNPISAAIQR